jgi:hypothetical protein
MLGQVTQAYPYLPVLKSKIVFKAYDNMYQAETASAMQTKEEVAMMSLITMLVYIKHKTVELLKENQKSAQQRVTDFLQLEKTELFQEMIY